MHNKFDNDLKKFLKLYEESFPEEERRPYRDVEELNRFLEDKAGNFEIRIFFGEKGEFQGFITLWHFSEFDYVEHFAVDPSLRGQGLGAKILREVAREGRPVLLEVEKPEEEMACRRVGFYERNGFRLEDYPYIQPPYQPSLPEVPMCLMTYAWPADLSLAEAATTLHREVYGLV